MKTKDTTKLFTEVMQNRPALTLVPLLPSRTVMDFSCYFRRCLCVTNHLICLLSFVDGFYVVDVVVLLMGFSHLDGGLYFDDWCHIFAVYTGIGTL